MLVQYRIAHTARASMRFPENKREGVIEQKK